MEDINMKTRTDAWSSEDDLQLTNTVLNYIRNGKTQLMAFEEVGKLLGRTAAACGFRWNSAVRKRHEDAFKRAKVERKQSKGEVQDISFAEPQPSEMNGEVDPFELLTAALKTATAAYKALQRDNANLRREIARLEKIQEETLKSEDLNNLIRLIKKSGLLDKKESPAS